MSKKLSKKERGEVVTKGYYYDTLEEILNKRLSELRVEFRGDVETLMEHQTHQLQSIFEGFDERYVLKKELKVAQ